MELESITKWRHGCTSVCQDLLERRQSKRH